MGDHFVCSMWALFWPFHILCLFIGAAEREERRGFGKSLEDNIYVKFSAMHNLRQRRGLKPDVGEPIKSNKVYWFSIISLTYIADIFFFFLLWLSAAQSRHILLKEYISASRYDCSINLRKSSCSHLSDIFMLSIARLNLTIDDDTQFPISRFDGCMVRKKLSLREMRMRAELDLLLHEKMTLIAPLF